jgi:hypothetical protein
MCIGLLFCLKIEWENRNQPGIERRWDCRVSVDGTDCRILDPRVPSFSPRWFGHKFKSAGVRYEVDVCIRSGWIVWINGPFPCGEWNDVKIAKSALIHELDEGELFVADKGYQTAMCYSITPNDLVFASQEQKDRHELIRARHEAINRRLKQWRILSSLFRHGFTKHGTAFMAVANITQFILRHESIPFQVEDFY